MTKKEIDLVSVNSLREIGRGTGRTQAMLERIVEYVALNIANDTPRNFLVVVHSDHYRYDISNRLVNLLLEKFHDDEKTITISTKNADIRLSWGESEEISVKFADINYHKNDSDSLVFLDHHAAFMSIERNLSGFHAWYSARIAFPEVYSFMERHTNCDNLNNPNFMLFARMYYTMKQLSGN